MQKAKRSLLLFDLDGTLTPARQSIIPEMVKCLTKIKSKFDLAIVGGSDRKKQLEQLGEGNVHLFKYIFSVFLSSACGTTFLFQLYCSSSSSTLCSSGTTKCESRIPK